MKLYKNKEGEFYIVKKGKKVIIEPKLTTNEIPVIKKIVIDMIKSKDENYFKWKDDPSLNKTKQDIFDTFKEKLNCAYTERLVMVMCYCINLINKGGNVAFVKKENDDWVVVCIDTNPVFHISPDDIPLVKHKEIIFESGDELWKWKGLTKDQELISFVENS